MWLTTMFRNVPIVWFSTMIVLSGMFPGIGWTANGKGALAWPGKGAVDYRASYGEGGIALGEGHYSWEHDGTKYKLRLALETTGMVAMLHRLDYVQMSQGSIGKDGLRPAQFDVIHKGKAPDVALFDWDGNPARVSIRRGGKEKHSLELTPGDQDMLSIWRQIGHVDKLPDSLLIVGNKNARRGKIVAHEDVDLKVPAGHFATRRFSARSDDGKLKIDFWVAKAQHMVPVRVVLTDDKTGTLVFEATAIRVPSAE